MVLHRRRDTQIFENFGERSSETINLSCVGTIGELSKRFTRRTQTTYMCYRYTCGTIIILLKAKP